MPDVVITGGEVHDGGGGPPVRADVEITGDRMHRIRPPAPGGPAGARLVIDAAGKAVCPGFINILSHSNRSILHDPRSLGELTQGVTTEVFGEGTSMGPLTPPMKAELEHEAERRPGLRDLLDPAVGIPGPCRAPRHRAERRLVHRRGNPARERRRLRRPAGHGRRAGPHARAGGRGDGRRRAGHRLGADLPAWQLRGHRGADRAVPGRRGVRRLLCLAHPQRGRGLQEALSEFLSICQGAGLRGELFHLKAAGATTGTRWTRRSS